MKPEEYAELLRHMLPKRDMLEQLAEECSELSKASLKLIRARHYSVNSTPLSVEQAEKDFHEEVMDVLSLIWLMGIHTSPICKYWKYERWVKRLINDDKKV